MSHLSLLRTFRSVTRAPRLVPIPPAARAYSSTPQQDDSHPHLYFHHQSGDKIALSYLETPPRTTRSAEIIGWLPNSSTAGVSDFQENSEFKNLMHASIRRAIESGQAATVETEALTRGSDGFMHIADERNLPPSGRIPEPEDIIASVYVKGGKALPETYEPQPMHRLLTSDGVTILPYGIDEFVLRDLKAASDAAQ